MSGSLLVEEFEKLPKPKRGIDQDMWQQRLRSAIRKFRKRSSKRYNEGTLLRVLEIGDPVSRKAAILALGGLGSWAANGPLARVLHDQDETLAKMAVDALWELWYRGGTDEQNNRLQGIMMIGDLPLAMQELNALAEENPDFAEVFNQRAIIHFQRGDFRRSIEDCQRALERNPYHFGAQCGIGHSYRKLQMIKPAIQAYRLALKINPTLRHLVDTLREMGASLEES